MLTAQLRFVALAAAFVVGAAACTPPPPPPGPDLYAATCARTLKLASAGPITDPAMTELSGLVASRTQPNVWYTHNDSGDTNRFFAIDSTGATLATFTVTGATAIDWEDIAIGPGPTPGLQYLYLADIGDNTSVRSEVQVYRIAEPAIPATNGSYPVAGAATLHLQYVGGPRDAESLLVDPRNGQLTIIEKRLSGGTVGVYRAPANMADGSVTIMSKVSTVQLPSSLLGSATGIDMSSDASVIALRTYGGVRVYKLANSASTTVESALKSTPCVTVVAGELQGEAVGIRANGSGFATVAEGVGPTLHFFDV